VPRPAIDAGPPEIDAGFPLSKKANLKFKGNERIRTDFARALGLDPTDVCKELGAFSCTHLVHQVALGGVEPYFLGLNEPLPFTTVTTPIATERVALAACGNRVDRDLGGSEEALIFVGLDVDASGKLTSHEDPAMAAAVDLLYKRALQREPTDDEVSELTGFYAEVEAKSAQPARDWAVLSCFAVMTTMEQLFY
jgi:hypothetical protein